MKHSTILCAVSATLLFASCAEQNSQSAEPGTQRKYATRLTDNYDIPRIADRQEKLNQ